MSERLLIVGPSWIGDMVIAQSLFIRLRRDDPENEIDVVAPDWSRPLLDRMPEVRRAIGLPVAHGRLGLRSRWRVGRSLRRAGYDRAVILPKSLKSALVPFFARIPLRTGFLGELRFGLINDVRPYDATSERAMVRWYLALGSPPSGEASQEIPRPALRIDEGNRRRLVEALRLQCRQPVVACVPGAEYGPAKAWPEPSWARLVGRLAEEGWRVWIFGSPAEQELGERVAASAGEGAVNLCGRTSLGDAVDLLSLAKMVVSNDTGLMHVAAAVGAPIVAVFGSSSPRYTPPLTDRARALYLDLDCSPCFQRRCPLGHYRCLREISVDAVVDAVHRLRATGATDRS